MEIFIIGLIIGGSISLIITHIYYKKSSSDQKVIFNKLSQDIRNAILSDTREKLSVAELNEIITEKSIDFNSKHPLPYVACPKCGSKNLLDKSDVEVDYDEDEPSLVCHYNIITCQDCGWSKNTLDGTEREAPIISQEIIDINRNEKEI